MSFEDNFSRHASHYARHRPGYPPELFAFIASTAPGHDRAWDCGTGNGQAAVGMAEHFERVIATDASAEQISHAMPHERVAYAVAPAEHAPIEDHAIDAVTVATAIHWFDLDRFYAEVQRVARPGGVIAAWSYFKHYVDPAIDPLVERFSSEIVGPHWSQRLRSQKESYTDLPFPFDEIETPSFAIETVWDIDAFIGYLGSWSATQKFKEIRGYDPIVEIGEELVSIWGAGERIVRWPLHLRVGRIAGDR